MKDNKKEILIEIEKTEKENFQKAQDNLEEYWGEDFYKLKTDKEILNLIGDFGFGETEFHTADVERLRWDKEFWKNKYLELKQRQDDDYERWGKEKLTMAKMGKKIHDVRLGMSKVKKLILDSKRKITEMKNRDDMIKARLLLSDGGGVNRFAVTNIFDEVKEELDNVYDLVRLK